MDYPTLRLKRTTQYQYEKMIDFLEKHPQLACGKITENFTKSDRQRLWQELADILNKFPGGPRKSCQQWRKTWNDLKTNARAKATGSKRFSISPIERKVLQLNKPNDVNNALKILNVGSVAIVNCDNPAEDTDRSNIKEGTSTSSDSDIRCEPKVQYDISRTLLNWSAMENVQLDSSLLSDHLNVHPTASLQSNCIIEDDGLQNGDMNDIKPSIRELTDEPESNDLADKIEAIFSTASENNHNKNGESSDTTRRTAAVEGIVFIEREKSKALSRIADAKEKLVMLKQKKLDIAREHLEIERKKLELERECFYLKERTTAAEEGKAKAFSVIAELLRSKYNL